AVDHGWRGDHVAASAPEINMRPSDLPRRLRLVSRCRKVSVESARRSTNQCLPPRCVAPLVSLTKRRIPSTACSNIDIDHINTRNRPCRNTDIRGRPPLPPTSYHFSISAGLVEAMSHERT